MEQVAQQASRWGEDHKTREIRVRTGAERRERGHNMAHDARGACGPEQSR